MPSIQVNSTNINTFSFTVSFDIKNRAVIFDTSGTTYNGASNSGDLYVQWIAFSLIDQDGIVLTTTPPQIPSPATNPVYTLDLSNINQSFLFQTYQIIGSIKDQDGTVYSTLPIYKKIYEPLGIGDNGTISGEFQLIADCSNNSLTVKELTLFAYNNLLPTTTTKSGTLYYPTGTVSPIAFSSTPFSNSYIVTGDYLVNNTSVATYDFGDGVFVILSYWTYNNFYITCSNTMSDVLCCMLEVQREAEKNCTNARGLAASEKLSQVTPYLLTGLIAEQSGNDASEQVKAIRKILNCGCGSKGNRQNELNPVNPSIYSIVLQGAGGTTIPSASVNGNTKTWTISSLTSKISKGNNSDLAWTIQLDNSVSNVNNFVITFNYGVFAGYIYTATNNSTPLLNQFNLMVDAGGVLDKISASPILTDELRSLTNNPYAAAYLVNNVPYLIYGNNPITLYSKVPFASGVTLYLDSGLTTPITGFLLVTPISSKTVYNINPTTGLVGTSTGVQNNTFEVYSDNYLINTFGYLVCGGTPITLYSSTPFGVGTILYFDSALTRPVTGYLLVTQLKNGYIYNLNSSTGVVGASTGTHC